MTSEALAAFMDKHSLNIGECAAVLELGRNTVARYLKEGAPLVVALACAAIDEGLEPFGG